MRGVIVHCQFATASTHGIRKAHYSSVPFRSVASLSHKPSRTWLHHHFLDDSVTNWPTIHPPGDLSKSCLTSHQRLRKGIHECLHITAHHLLHKRIRKSTQQSIHKTVPHEIVPIAFVDKITHRDAYKSVLIGVFPRVNTRAFTRASTSWLVAGWLHGWLVGWLAGWLACWR